MENQLQIEKEFCHVCHKELGVNDADFSELVGFDLCSECSTQISINFSYEI